MDGAEDLVDGLLADWCQRHLGSRPVRALLSVRRISRVHGVVLADGREVVLKVRGAQARQAACAIVQRVLWQAGIPCPRPLAGPLPLVGPRTAVALPDDEGRPTVDAAGLAVSAESWEGHAAPSPGPFTPADWAGILARIVAAAPDPAHLPTLEPPPPWLFYDHAARGRVWPPPASRRWDPHRVADELDPIVLEVATRARARLLRADVAALPRVTGHGDLEPQNCRWVRRGDGLVHFVVHDWDSVVALPEAVLAGNSALTQSSVDADAMSSPEADAELLAAYAALRGRPWTRVEREAAAATGAWVGAYNAAFEHLKAGPGPVTEGLHRQGRERLARAGA